jgi:hypothetical protein
LASRRSLSHFAQLRTRLKKLPILTGIARYLFFWVLVLLLFGGIMTAAHRSAQSRLAGWLSIMIGIAVAMLSIRTWPRTLPSVFASATLDGLIILSGGHALNHPEVPFPRWEALLIISLTVWATVITAPFANRPLTRIDQIAAFGILVCFVGMFVGIEMTMSHWEITVGMGLVVCLAVIKIGRIQTQAQIKQSRAALKHF